MPKAKWIVGVALVSAVVSALLIRAWVNAPDGSTVSKLISGK